MPAWKIALLGMVQGLTEFLPVSSDGHLAVGQRLLGLHGDLALTILLHAGTLVAALLFFRRDVLELLREALASARDPSRLRRDPRGEQLLAVVLTTVVTGVIGISLKHPVERWTQDLRVVGVCFLATAGVLLATLRAQEKPAFRFSPGVAIALGAAQGLAVLPGLSRSACTLAAALLLGAPPTAAFRYSFVASLPAIGGALLLELRHPAVLQQVGAGPAALGIAVSFVVGLGALLGLRGAVSRGRLWVFALYVIPAALTTLGLGLFAP